MTSLRCWPQRRSTTVLFSCTGYLPTFVAQVHGSQKSQQPPSGHISNGWTRITIALSTGRVLLVPEALYRHLRTLNEVLLPLEDREDATVEKPRASGYERVLFRHWDPNVLGATLPILTRAQFTRFLGPADGLAFNGPDYGGVRRVRKPDNMPDAAIGPLKLEPDQIERLKAAMLHSSRLRIARFLKKNMPPHFTGIDDDFVWGATLASELTADELGIQTERVARDGPMSWLSRTARPPNFLRCAISLVRRERLPISGSRS